MSETSRYVTVFHQLKETEHGERGDRMVVLGTELEDRHIFDEDEGEFYPYARPIAVLDAGAELDEEGLTEWCNSYAGKCALHRFFPNIEPDDPTLPDSEEYLERSVRAETERSGGGDRA